MNKLFAYLIIFTFVLIGIASADCQLHKQNTAYTLTVQSNNATSCNWTYLQTPNGNLTNLNIPMTKEGNTFYYLISSNNYSQVGETYHGISCTDGLTTLPGSVCLNITPDGTVQSTSQSLIFIVIMFILILFMIAGFYGISKSISVVWTIAYICLAYLSLFGIFFISWVYSTNYLYSTPILASIFWIFWLIMGFGFLPFIFIVSGYIIKRGIEDTLSKDYISQGYDKEQAHEMAKRRRH